MLAISGSVQNAGHYVSFRASKKSAVCGVMNQSFVPRRGPGLCGLGNLPL